MSDDDQVPQDGDEQTVPNASDDAAAEPSADGDVAPAGPGTPEEPVTTPKRPVRPAASAASRARRIGGSAVRPGVSGVDRSDSPERETPVATSDVVAGKPVSTEKAPKEAAAAATGDDSGAGRRSLLGRKRAGKNSTSDSRNNSRNGSTSAASDRRRRWDTRAALRWLPAAVLSAAALAMAVVLIVVITTGRWDRPESSTVRDQVLSAAKTCVVATNTYKYTDLDAFEKKGLACASSTFATQFKQSVDKLLRKLAPTVKQTQTFQVNNAGIVDVSSGNEWQVLIYGQVSVVNISTKGRVDPYGALARLQKVDGQWRIVALDTLCSASLLTSGNKCT